MVGGSSTVRKFYHTGGVGGGIGEQCSNVSWISFHWITRLSQWGLVKIANMTPKVFFVNIFNIGIKKRRIWCQFWIHWKSIKKIYTKKVRVLKSEKVHNFSLLGKRQLFIWIKLFYRIWNQHWILRFLIPIIHTKRLKKTKNLSFKCESEFTIFSNSGFGATRF